MWLSSGRVRQGEIVRRGWLTGTGVVLLGATVLLAVLGAAEYRKLFVPPGRFVQPKRVGFVAETGPSGLPLPLSYRTYEAVSATVPAGIRLGRAAALPEAAAGSGQVTERTLVIDSAFWDIAHLSVVAGRPLLSSDGDPGQPSVCVVRRGLEAGLGAPGDTVGREVRTPVGSCIVVGLVASEVLHYWFPEAGVLVQWQGKEPALDARLAAFVDYNIFHVSYELPVGTSATVLQEQLARSDGSFPRSERLIAIGVSSYLFPGRAVAAARSAGVSAAFGLGLGILGALMMVYLDVMRRRDELEVLWAIGASPALYFGRVFMQNVVRYGLVGTLVVVVALGAALARSPAGGSLQNTLWVALASAGLSCVVLSLLDAAGRAYWLHRFRRTTPRRRPSTARPMLRGLLLLQTCAAMLLICAFSYREAYSALTSGSLGMSPDQVSVAELRGPGRLESRMVAETSVKLMSRLGAIPGVQAVSVTSSNPVAVSPWTTTVTIEGGGQFLNGPSRDGRVVVTPGKTAVGPGFVAAVGARVLSGREFTSDDDSASRRVALVNESMARTYWGQATPLGRRLKFRPARDSGEDWAEVVGVVSDMQHEGYRGKLKPEAYVSVLQEKSTASVLFVLLRGRSLSTHTEEIQGVIAGEAPQLAIRRVFLLGDEARRSVDTLRRATVFFNVLAVLGVMAGCFAAVLTTLSLADARRRELGVRMALGAGTFAIAATLLRPIIRAGGVAAAGGIAAGVGVNRWLGAIDPDVAGASPAGLLLSILGIVFPLLFSGVAVALVWRRRLPSELLRESSS